MTMTKGHDGDNNYNSDGDNDDSPDDDDKVTEWPVPWRASAN